jgi:hypothetical protein
MEKFVKFSEMLKRAMNNAEFRQEWEALESEFARKSEKIEVQIAKNFSNKQKRVMQNHPASN